MELHKIKMKNIVDVYGDRSFQIHLQIYTDADGVVYSIVTSMNTIDQGSLGFNLTYKGGDYAHMWVSQQIHNMNYIHKYDYAVPLFTKVFKRMLHSHLKQLSYKCIYSGCTDVVGLINKVLQFGIQKKN